MTEGYGAQGMVGRLRRVVMRRPGEAMAAADPAAWHYTGAIDLEEARRAHDAFADALRAWDVEVLYHDEPLPEHSDSVFVFDPVLVTDQGTLVLSMGKERRRGEEEPLARALQDCGVPVFGRLEGDARVEGGDTLWLDHDTLAVGRGFRTNAEGVRQLRGLLGPLGVTVLDYDLPYFTGPEACLHLLSLISPVDVDLAVAYPPLMPTAFWAELTRRGIRLLEVPEEEFTRTQATNVLAVAPRKCIMLDGNPVTQQLLEMADCEVVTFPGAPLSFKAEGGPTCLTRPVLRDPRVRPAMGGELSRGRARRARRAGPGRTRRVAARAHRDPEPRRRGDRGAAAESPRGCARPDSRPTCGRSTSRSSRATPTGATRSTATTPWASSAGTASRRPAGRPRAAPPAATCC